MAAARQAGKTDPSGDSFAAAASRESFLNPLLGRVEKLISDGTRNRSRPPSWGNRNSKRNGSWNPLRRFNWRLPVPNAPSTESLAGAAGQSRPWLYAVLIAALAILLVPVWIRFRPKLAAYLNAPRVVTKFALRRIESPNDLVRAVDRFLFAQFGLASCWWHCRAVERALAGLRPDLRGEISELVEAYELSRYGPDPAEISPSRVQQAAATLRRLADSLLAAAEPAPQPGVIAAGA
jgi:hypothetical protein